MNDLSNRSCQPCRQGDEPLSNAKIAEFMTLLPEWKIIERESIPRLEKSFEFPDFQEALDFANLVGELAEKEDHHPAILVSWGRAAVSWWTFVVNGLHENDFILAARTDEIYQSLTKKEMKR